MGKLNFKTNVAALAATALCVCTTTPATAGVIDLTTAGASDTILGATFTQVSPQSTGTGVIDSFLRVQANGNEAGYNTDNGTPFDDKGGSFTHSILLASVPIVNLNGVDNYQFLLDINQTTGQLNANLLSLNQLQIFQADNGASSGGAVSAAGYLSTLPSGNLTSVYDMNPGGGTANGVKLNYDLNPGSGAGDMFLYVPKTAFSGNGTFVVLYSQFGDLGGDPSGRFASNDGFEEWATVVPEPTTMIAGALLLLPFGASTLRVLRNRKA
jgi:hypothetical protein